MNNHPDDHLTSSLSEPPAAPESAVKPAEAHLPLEGDDSSYI